MVSKVQGLSTEIAHVLNIDCTTALIRQFNRSVDYGKPES